MLLTLHYWFMRESYLITLVKMLAEISGIREGLPQQMVSCGDKSS